jgi:sphingosine kinase
MFHDSLFFQTIFSFLSVGWGLIADIDIESERLRSIGQKRFTVWSIHRLISLRTYVGKVSYLPVLASANQRKPHQAITSGISLKHSTSHNTTLNCPVCHGHGECETCDIEFGDVLSLETVNEKDSVRPRFDSW